MFKDYPPIIESHSFTTSDSTTNSYFYYLFTSQSAQTNRASNLASSSSFPSLSLQSGSLTFTLGLYVKLRF